MCSQNTNPDFVDRKWPHNDILKIGPIYFNTLFWPPSPSPKENNVFHTYLHGYQKYGVVLKYWSWSFHFCFVSNFEIQLDLHVDSPHINNKYQTYVYGY